MMSRMVIHQITDVIFKGGADAALSVWPTSGLLSTLE